MDREGKDRPIRGRGEQEIRRTQSGHPVSGQGRRRPGTGSSDLKKIISGERALQEHRIRKMESGEVHPGMTESGEMRHREE